MNRPDTDAQDQLLQIITFGLQRAAGPYRWAIFRLGPVCETNIPLTSPCQRNVAQWLWRYPHRLSSQ